jgi:hypothetical protein
MVDVHPTREQLERALSITEKRCPSVGMGMDVLELRTESV